MQRRIASDTLALLELEREVNALRQEISASRSWIERVEQVTSAMASSEGPGEALVLLARSLVSESQYEFAFLLPEGGEHILCGSLAEESLLSLLEAASALREDPTVRIFDLDARSEKHPCWLLGGGIRLREDGSRAAIAIVGRTARTHGFYAPPWQTDLLQFRHLLETSAHVIAAVRARAALVEERNSLAAAVHLATQQLRLALAQAEAARGTAEAASRAKSVFLANMSHELRTPLNAIIGYAELLLGDAAEQDLPDLQQDLGRICSSGRHLLALISDILDLAKIEAGRMEIYLRPFDASALVEGVCQGLGSIASARRNYLRLTLPGGPLVITSDEMKLRQIVLNLVSNACKFTDHGTIDVTLEAIGEQIAVTVQDTGIGMGPKLKARLFEPFYSTDAPVIGRSGGTGLGLAISRQFCELLGGSIDVQSELGSGSRFQVCLPRNSPTIVSS